MVMSNVTTTTQLQDSLPSIRQSARLVREQRKVMTSVVDVQQLGEGEGVDWNEISLEQLTASSITETTVLDNPQLIVDTLFTVTPVIIGIHIVVTDKAKMRVSANVINLTGGLGQNAIERKKDQDGLTVGAAAGTDLGSAGGAVLSGYVRAARYRISSDATEPGPDPIVGVFHGFHIKYFEDEILGLAPAAGGGPANEVGTQTGMIGNNLADTTFSNSLGNGLVGRLGGVRIHEDGNMTIDSADDAESFIFSQMGIVLVQGRSPRMVVVRREDIGGGSEVLYHYDEYAFGERSSGNWLVSITGDALVPTS
jgi:hypothetical protein